MKVSLVSMKTSLSLMLEEDGPDMKFCQSSDVVSTLVSRPRD